MKKPRRPQTVTKKMTYADRKYLDYEVPALSIMQDQKAKPESNKDTVQYTVKQDYVLSEEGKVALFSERNITWQDVGRVYRGLNLVAAETVELWITRPHTRLATQAEFDKEFGKK